jgi:CheY-like chemotaxis protein
VAGVLVVEDESLLRQAVVKKLRMSGYEVFEAGDGSFAIDVLRTSADKIDVILLDMTIPGASSRQVMAEAANLLPDVGVILTSAYGQEMFSGAMAAPQVRGFIRKPFPLAHLEKMLRQCLAS